MSKRERILAEPVPSWPERRARIESQPLPSSVPALLAEAAAAAPDTIAIDFFEEGERRTYRQLAAEVELLAGALKARGVGRGTHVGVMLPNVIAFPITWLAIARLGAVMVPINDASTPRELHYVLTDADIEFLVIDAGCEDELAAIPDPPSNLRADRVIRHEGASSESWRALLATGASETVAPCPAAHDDLLNIQYTSGTTGFPKGCMLTHLYWLVTGKVNAERDGRDFRRILAATPFFYMDPQWQLLMAFYRRATLFVARRQSASRFMEWVRRHRIHFTLLPEIVYKQPPSPEDANNEIIRVNCYGLSRRNHAAIEARYDFVCREAFGMTEVGSALFVPMEATETVGSGTCGVPVAFRETRIVDETGADVPTGETGELIVRGAGIFQGYYKKPDATAAALRNGWFHTGDLFRRDAAGYHYIVGRKKDMIRRAGENIAAREVEAVLRALPQIAEAAAVPVPDAMRGEEVKVLLRLQPGLTAADVPPEKVIAHCAEGLARFKVPRYIAYVDALPYTSSGKIAKHLLASDDPLAGTWDRVDGVWR